MLEKFLQEMDEIVSADYVPVKIDLSTMAHGEEVGKQLRKSRGGGIPWMVILDADGNELISSDGPAGNCGYPFEPEEIDHFLTMLRTTSRRVTEGQLAQIKAALDDYREKKQAK